MADSNANRGGGGKYEEEKDQQSAGDKKPIKMSEGLPKKSSGIKLSIGQKRKNEQGEKSNGKQKAIKGDEKMSAGVSLAFAPKQEKEKTEATLNEKKGAVARAFGDDSESEEEEMPKEARMRMRNIGRDTPTSAGPNSYNKGKQGFVNHNKMWDREMKPRIHLEKPPEKS